MSTTATVRIQALLDVELGVEELVCKFLNNLSPGKRDLITVGTSSASIGTIPTDTRAIMLVPPKGNTTSWFLADTAGRASGTTLDPEMPCLVFVPASTPAVYVGSITSSITNVQVYYL